ncbi:DUF6236 family protein [Tundrisphaera lichenicola]|uniref:DUF6236 family protein n=1 Tax=Tundrisphaera lichenicola TaxID=2029860 RepID=UPI003EBA5352
MGTISKIGLYYPLIHFKDDGWLKLSALYWDKMGRIVPESYPMGRESDTVEVLKECKYITNFSPESAANSPTRPVDDAGQPVTLAARFITVLERHAEALSARYDVRARAAWGDALVTCMGRPPTGPASLSYIHSSKMDIPLARSLEEAHLLVRTDNDDPAWFGMHPSLAQIYMMVLTDEVAAAEHLHPVTDETLDHVATGGWTVERLAYGLLGRHNETVLPPTPQNPDEEVEQRLASIAIQTFVPRDPGAIEVDTILKLRDRYPEQRAVFQSWISELTAELGSLERASQKSLDSHLEVVAQKYITPKVQELHRNLRSVGIETMTGIFNIKIAVPALLSGLGTAGLTINPVLGVGAGLAVGIIPVLQNSQRKAREAERANPAAFLMRVEEGLNPRKFLERIQEKLLKFITQV